MLPLQAFMPLRRAAADDALALVARLASGDAAALDAIYRTESGPVYRYALALCGNAEWAADATQDAFVALATRPQAFDPARGTLGAYLAGVARHRLAAHWRSARSEQALIDDLDSDEPGDNAVDEHSPSPEQLLVRAQGQADFWAALRQVPAAFREALVLVDLQERPYAEAAQIAGIELNTLRTRVHRARSKLAALLGTQHGGSP
jgi:RNA polymerase sigma-70 factor, ECF subfamily